MKPTIKAIKEMHNQANEVANHMRQNTSDAIVPTWLVDIYKKSGISSILMNLK